MNSLVAGLAAAIVAGVALDRIVTRMQELWRGAGAILLHEEPIAAGPSPKTRRARPH